MASYGQLPTVAYNPVFQGRATTQSAGGSINTTPLPQSYPTSSSFNASGALGALGSLGSSIINGLFSNYQQNKQMKWNEKMNDLQWERDLEMWNMTNEYNSPVEQIKRMKDAGLNPLNYGLDGSSASAMQAPQPLGYQRADSPNIENPIAVALSTALQKAQIEQMDATTQKIKSETFGSDLENEFNQRVMNAKVEGVELANSLTKEQIKAVEASKRETEQNIQNLIKQAKTEEERAILVHWQAEYQRMSAEEIVQLLPYKKNLMEAQTQAQKAQASLAFAQAAIQKGLLEKGYVDKMLEQIQAEIDKNASQKELTEANAAIQKIKARLQNGEAIDIDSIPWSRPTDKVAGYVWNKLIQRMSELSTAGLGALSGLLG